MEIVPHHFPGDTIRLAVSLIFKAIPRRLRFRAMVQFSRLMRPVVARTYAFSTREKLGTDRVQETTLELIMTELTRRGVEFDPLVEIDGLEYYPRPGDDHPRLLIGAHMMLNSLIARHLYDHGMIIGAITAETAMRYPGTKVPVDAITPADARLFEVRRRLRNGGIVSALIDREIPERRTLEFETSNGKLVVSTALLQVGLRMNAHIVFFGTRMRDDDSIVMTLRPAEETTVEALAAEFAAFIDELITSAPSLPSSARRTASSR